jgi:peptidoglycan/LPS O-acetylase OafA/YrhL
VNTKDRGGSGASVAGGARSPAIDGIRGLAALALLTVHVALFSGLLGTKAFGEPRPPSNIVGAFFVSGLPSFIGVLFVLPGMFLYLPLAKAIISGTKRPPQGKPFLRRLLRLLPGYYVMYLVVLFTLNRDHIDGIWYVLKSILLLQVFTQNPFQPQLMNGMEITWTVPTMVQWYAILPLIAWAVHRFAARGTTPESRARRLMLPVPVLIAIGVAWLFFVKGNGWDNRMVFWWPQGFAPTIGIGMALAIKLALSQVKPASTPKLLRVATTRPNLFLLAAVVLYIINCARPFSVIGMDAIYSTTGLLVTYVMVALFGLCAVTPLIVPGGGSRLITATLTSKPVVHLGKVGFGIYLWHFAVMHFYLQPGALLRGDARPIKEFYGTVGFWQLELATVAGATLLATLSYYLVEKPAMAWGEQFLRRPRGERKPKKPVSLLLTGVAATTEMTPEEVARAAAAATADRDAIRVNLLALEADLAARLPAELTGRTRQRKEAADADLARLWEIFGAYSSTVDDIDAAPRSPALAAALTGPSVLLSDIPKPLAERHITDAGHTRYTLGQAVTEMNRLFTRTVELVTTVQQLWTEVPEALDRIAADITVARADDHADGTLRTEAMAAEATVQRLRLLLTADPLSFWDTDHVDHGDLDRLRQDVADALARARGRADEDQSLAG